MAESAVMKDVKSEILGLEKALAGAAVYVMGEARQGKVEISRTCEGETPMLRDLAAMHSKAIAGVAARNGINIPSWRITCYVMDVYGTFTMMPIQNENMEVYERTAVSKGKLIRLLGDHVPELTEPHNLNSGEIIPPGKEDFAYWLREHLRE